MVDSALDDQDRRLAGLEIVAGGEVAVALGVALRCAQASQRLRALEPPFPGVVRHVAADRAMQYHSFDPGIDDHCELADAAAVAVADESDLAHVRLGEGAERADEVQRSPKLADDLRQGSRTGPGS